MPKILIVDDEPAIRFLLQDILSELTYETLTAENGVEALAVLGKDPGVDMIISDINMPKMMGFELLAKVETLYPHIKRVLITAYNVEDYLALSVQHGISNILTKTTPFNFDEVTSVIQNLLSENVFGIDHFLRPNTPTHSIAITDPSKIHDYTLQMLESLRPPGNSHNLEMVVVELLNNAIFYGIKDMDPEKKEDWNDQFILNEGEVNLSWGKDEEKIIFSVSDSGGKLTKKKVLHWLSRQIDKDDTGMPVGLLDFHGRGFFISREYVDRLIINIKKNIRTEIICLQYVKGSYQGHKPLLINEI
ncbi:MAG: hypothetical protein A2293_12640 [Elusimicrobia bacterium RIFOXYB2_FULL_49_7]|nr:MAG: hypothetical protein A2293_12640 [Elusimicrobia bacterium RIFOXYB2_FULL_49_7]